MFLLIDEMGIILHNNIYYNIILLSNSLLKFELCGSLQGVNMSEYFFKCLIKMLKPLRFDATKA